MHRLRCEGYGASLPVNLYHPVIQASVGIAHDVVENDQLFELLAERLLELVGPRKLGGLVWQALLRLVFVVARILLWYRRRSAGSAVVGPLLLAAACIVGAEACPVLIWPWILAEEDVGILETLQEDLETAWLRWESLLLAVKASPVPVRVVERL